MSVVESWNIVPVYVRTPSLSYESRARDGQRPLDPLTRVDQIMYPLTSSLRVDGALYADIAERWVVNDWILQARIFFIHYYLNEEVSFSYNCLRPKHHVYMESIVIMVVRVRCLIKQMTYDLLYHDGGMLKIGNAAVTTISSSVLWTGHPRISKYGISVSLSRWLRRKSDKRDVVCVVDRITDHVRNRRTMTHVPFKTSRFAMDEVESLTLISRVPCGTVDCRLREEMSTQSQSVGLSEDDKNEHVIVTERETRSCTTFVVIIDSPSRVNTVSLELSRSREKWKGGIRAKLLKRFVKKINAFTLSVVILVSLCLVIDVSRSLRWLTGLKICLSTLDWKCRRTSVHPNATSLKTMSQTVKGWDTIIRLSSCQDSDLNCFV